MYDMTCGTSVTVNIGKCIEIGRKEGFQNPNLEIVFLYPRFVYIGNGYSVAKQGHIPWYIVNDTHHYILCFMAKTSASLALKECGWPSQEFFMFSTNLRKQGHNL